MGKVRKGLDETERRLFRDAVKDVKPLRREFRDPYRRRPAPRPIVQPDRKRETALPSPSDWERETPDLLAFKRPGIQERVFADLKRGRIDIEWELDLHGLTRAQAQETLADFFSDCRRRRMRCVQIVHGKGHRSQRGQPILKCLVNAWLRRKEEVLAFCSAQARDGGTGAVYVLLRNPGKSSRRR